MLSAQSVRGNIDFQAGADSSLTEDVRVAVYDDGTFKTLTTITHDRTAMTQAVGRQRAALKAGQDIIRAGLRTQRARAAGSRCRTRLHAGHLSVTDCTAFHWPSRCGIKSTVGTITNGDHAQ
ncbi:hypothetical protein [Rhizobacter sp. Root1221]|uniref:hypothetical protein n=1 Tax=Rhizobacter sp. Root1221 TaxID=1736433 RepID=UPI000AD5836F|nr:hypothetical protein [Rhizobacter sp. Root1221]